MSSVANIASLLIATMDLSVVKLLRDAIRTADLSSAATIGKRMTDRFEPGRVFHPEPRYEPRRVIHPEPKIEPRPALMADAPRLALQNLAVEAPDKCACDTPSPATKSTIEPPWRKLPWHEPMPPRKVVKIVVQPPDIIRTGRLIDFYT